jgi:hypothetical protein
MLLYSALPRGHKTGSSADPVHRVLRAGVSSCRSSPCAHRALISFSTCFPYRFLSCPACFPVASTIPRPCRQPCYDPASVRERYEVSGAVSSEPGTRSARGNTRRRCASSKHAWLGCRYAPRPGRRAWGSGTIPSPATTRRSKLDFAARALHPTQVRIGFFPVSGSSTRAVIAQPVYRVAMSGVPGEVGGTRSQAAPRLCVGGGPRRLGRLAGRGTRRGR